MGKSERKERTSNSQDFYRFCYTYSPDVIASATVYSPISQATMSKTANDASRELSGLIGWEGIRNITLIIPNPEAYNRSLLPLINRATSLSQRYSNLKIFIDDPIVSINYDNVSKLFDISEVDFNQAVGVYARYRAKKLQVRAEDEIARILNLPSVEKITQREILYEVENLNGIGQNRAYQLFDQIHTDLKQKSRKGVFELLQKGGVFFAFVPPEFRTVFNPYYAAPPNGSLKV